MPTYASPHPVPVTIGVIGGSGVYKLNCLHAPTYYDVPTPFGNPSGPICVAQIKNQHAGGPSDPEYITCAFLPRHGPHHSFCPTDVNYRANIYAMRLLGVQYLLAINAVGSLDAHYKPGDLVLVDQLIDKTTRRASTFFAMPDCPGVVAHVDFAFPTSQPLSQLAFAALTEVFPHARRRLRCPTEAEADSASPLTANAEAGAGGENFTLHAAGTLVVMEGPQFSTRAESMSNKHALCGHLIGMTTMPEAKLAREAEMSYACIAMVTDNDAWQHGAPHVDTSAVMKVVAANGAKAQAYPPAIISKLAYTLAFDAEAAGKSQPQTVAPEARVALQQSKQALEADPAHTALAFAVMTHPEFIPPETKAKLAPILGERYPAFRV